MHIFLLYALATAVGQCTISAALRDAFAGSVDRTKRRKFLVSVSEMFRHRLRISELRVSPGPFYVDISCVTSLYVSVFYSLLLEQQSACAM